MVSKKKNKYSVYLEFFSNPVFFLSWIAVLALLYPLNCFALSEKKIESVTNHGVTMAAVIYDRKKDTYATISSFSQEKPQYKFNKNTVTLASYNYGKIKFSFNTFQEFKRNFDPIHNKITHYKKLPKAIHNYLSILNIPDFDLEISYYLIPNKFGMYYKSKERKANDKVSLEFINSLSREAISQFTLNFENFTLGTTPHELFHFIMRYKKYPKIKELREEIYASIFGECVAYSINSKIKPKLDILEFPNSFYKNPTNDLKKIRKKIKKAKLINSRFGKIIALYYFQAIAKNHSGVNIHSNNIPKFCHKLFSEHNFKYPIEKKPPPWFNEFLL